MKECPICHTKNDNKNLRCAACGLNLENVQNIESDIIVEENKQPLKNNRTIIIFSVIILIIMVILISLCFKVNNFYSKYTSNESVQSNYEYDPLQQIFLKSDYIITPEHLEYYSKEYIDKYNLCCKRKEIYKNDVIVYKIAYTEDVAEIKYPERGDYVQFVFDTDHNGWLDHSVYFNNSAYNSEDICTAVYSKATYSGHYSYKYKKNLDKSNLTFDNAESVINRIIDNTNTVYITPFSKKYHYSISCAGKNATAVKLDQLDEDFKPCKECIE